jgi:5-methylcytosine-specific restriction enzyme subunit McrC
VAAKALTAFEHGEVSVAFEPSADALSGAEAAWLDDLSVRLPRFCERGHRSVRFGSYCGITTVGSRTLELLPKVDELSEPGECRGILLGLLQRTRESVLFRQLPMGQRLRSAPLLEVFIAAFFDEVSRVVRAGLLREYQAHEDDLRAVRGRIVVNRQFTALADRRDLISCQFDELTADNAWNRFVKAGLRAVRPWIADVELGRRWVELMIAFEEVADVPTEATDLMRLKVDRKAARYLRGAEWARRILEVLSPSLRSGRQTSPGLLFDINKLWEDAVAAELGRRVRAAGFELQTQAAGAYLAALADTGTRVVGLRPDLLIVQRGRVCAIADTKWKRVEVSRTGHIVPSREDVYQMYAYSAAFGCDQLALIYPWHRDLAGSRESMLELPPIAGVRPRLSVICLDPQDGGLSIKLGAAGITGLTLAAA